MIAELAIAAAIAGAGAAGQPIAAKPEPHALVVTETQGFRHDSIPAALAAIQRISDRSTALDIVALPSSRSLTARALRRAKAVVFLSTTGELSMGRAGRTRLLHWIRKGGGFAGFHAASNTFDSSPAYGRMLGAQFKAHPFAGRGTVIVTDRSHPTTRRLPASFVAHDEFYVFKTNPRLRAHVLARRRASAEEPLIWWRREGRGRVFYSALGHPPSAWSDPTHLRLVEDGLRWVTSGRSSGAT